MSYPVYFIGKKKRKDLYECGELGCKNTFRLLGLDPLSKRILAKNIKKMKAAGQIKECSGCTFKVMRCRNCAHESTSCCKSCGAEVGY